MNKHILIISIALLLGACAKDDSASMPKDSVFSAWQGPQLGAWDMSTWHYGSQSAVINGCVCRVHVNGWPNTGQMRMSQCEPSDSTVGSMECLELNKEYFYAVASGSMELCQPGEFENDPPHSCMIYR